jgi:hypothetical protein
MSVTGFEGKIYILNVTASFVRPEKLSVATIL